jgi:hypothetical protein
MDLDEMLAIIAAPIYAATCNRYLPQDQEQRNRLMEEAVEQAQQIWEIARQKGGAPSSPLRRFPR